MRFSAARTGAISVSKPNCRIRAISAAPSWAMRRWSSRATPMAGVIGRFTQMLPNNWKLYFENVKDSYHASILHLFFTTFQLNRLSQRGGIIVDPSGGHHVSYSAVDHAAEAAAQAKAASD